ncbi:hypothetical protein AB0H17_23765 [Streptomyces olivoreticuli]
MALRMEADVHVDDVVVELADGTRAYVQAKLSGSSAAFTDTVAQWCGAVAAEECRPGDELLLVAAEVPGRVLRLAGALESRRAGASLASAASVELARLRELAAAHGLDGGARERLLDAAKIYVLDARDGRQQEALGAACLNAAVVPAGQGLAAFRALRAAAHTLAEKRAPSDVAVWRGWLRDAGIPLVADAEGSLAARLEARCRAIADYRAQWAGEQDVLPLADLGLGLVSLTVAGLTDGLRVLPEGQAAGRGCLADAVRRQGRLLLFGKPGAGKTVASRLIAARWAASSTAPVPVWLRLRDLVSVLPPAGPYRLESSDLVRVAVGTGRPVLEAALVERLEHGRALLVLDSLDEIPDRRDAVVEAVAGLIGRLPAGLDVMVTSRYSSAQAASLLQLPVYELQEPWNLSGTLDEILQSAASRFVPADEAGRWIADCQYRIARSTVAEAEVWQVPLLATLLVLLIAQHPAKAVPSSRAGLLTEVIDSSVRRWELRRISVTVPDTDAGLTADVLLDCYADIAHVVAVGPAHWHEAHRAVSERLREYWGKSPGAAAAAATHIIEYWDATAGVFITHTPRGTLAARTRLFAEIGEAHWALRNPPLLDTWMTDSLADVERLETVRLAASLSPAAAQSLIIRALEKGDGQLLDLVHEALVDGAVFDEATLHTYRQAQLNRLPALPDCYPDPEFASLNTSIHSAERRSPRAALAARLADDDLDATQSEQLIDIAVRTLPQEAALVSALCVQRQARSRGTAMTEQELDILEAGLLPQVGGRTLPVSKCPDGIGLLVMTAVKHLLPLRPHIVPALITTIREAPLSLVKWLEVELPRLGYQDVLRSLPTHAPGPMTRYLRSVAHFLAPFELLADMADENLGIAPQHAWHLDEAAAFVQAIGLSAAMTGIPGQAAHAHPSLARKIFEAALQASGLEPTLVTAEIRSLRDERPDRPHWGLLLHPGGRAPSVSLSSSAFDTSLFLEVLSSGNPWLIDLVFTMTQNVACLASDFPDRLLTALPSLPAIARFKAATLLARRWPALPLPDNDPATRAGAARIKARDLAEEQRHHEAQPLLADPDLLVRSEAAAALGAIPPATRTSLQKMLHIPVRQWTCLICDVPAPASARACSRGVS